MGKAVHDLNRPSAVMACSLKLHTLPDMTLLLGSPLCYVYPVITHFKCDLYFKFSSDNIPYFNFVGQGHCHSDRHSNWDIMFEYLNIILIYRSCIPHEMFLKCHLTG